MLIIHVGTQFTFEPKIGVFKEDARVEKTRAADGKLVEGGPAAGRSGGGGGGEKIGDKGRDCLGAFCFPTNVVH